MKKIILVFLLSYGFSCFSQQKSSTAKTINLDGLKVNVEKMMHEYNLKGLSVAVFENYKIIWTNEWGVKAADSKERIDRNTAYSTASISKPIVALVCAILEEKGLINLDEPISKYLKRWQLPQSNFTKDTEVTWKHLLSHTAGTSQGGFEDYYQGDSMPTIVQSLQGKLLPRSKEEIKFLFKPGTNWEYSGGGYVIIQCALEDHLGKPLAQIVKENLLDPLKLKNSTMIQPNEKGFLTNITKVHNSKGEIIRTGIPITPQVAPSGLWSTPTDLAIIAIEVQKALLGKGNKVISTAVAKKVTDIVTLMGSRGWSYGWQRNLGWGNQDWFSHDGSNTGVGGELLATMKKGNGIAILANGDKPNRIPLMSYVENTIMAELNWNVSFDEKSAKNIPEQLSKAIIGYYTEILFGYNRFGVTKIFKEDEKLYLGSPFFKENMGIDKSRMYYMGNNTFKIDNYPNFIQFNLNHNNILEGITIFRDSSDLKKIQIQLNEIRTPETKAIQIFTENKYEEAINKFEKLCLEYPAFSFESVLNNLGYSFYSKKQIDLSVKIFNLNCIKYPKSANTFDSLGEIYEIIGELELAKKNYKESLQLNPENSNAKEMIKKIEKRLGTKS
ncbi:beta-lactamase family protein [Flavobacterium aestivum]|uniref:beta-lactamase family protein n=1 Tax=Flavobacterium aestivum TaxID=3003257 RepID=UPI002482AD78|nr:beta-lactamase family protein [Flavobacterium aestivum]